MLEAIDKLPLTEDLARKFLQNVRKPNKTETTRGIKFKFWENIYFSKNEISKKRTRYQ